MPPILRLILPLLLLFLAAFADDNTTLNFEQLRKNYEKGQNFWFGIYREKKKITQTQERIEAIRKRLETKLKSAERKELQEELSEQNAKLEMLQDLDQRYSKSIDISLKELETLEINFFTFLTGSPRRKVIEFTRQLDTIRSEYESSLTYIDSTFEQASTLLSTVTNPSELDAIKSFMAELEETRLYFIRSLELLMQQYQSLRTYDRIIKRKMTDYQEHDLLLIGISFLIVAFMITAMLAARRLVAHYVPDEDRQFAFRHSINLIATLLIVLILIFFYIEKVTHALTVLGFIGVGLTIVLKEMWLNIAGWLYISFSRVIRIGDRIMMTDQTKPVIGDVIGISPTRITLYEMINHTSAVELKRAGRIAVVPTNFIFSHAFYNYTHENMKTLYDLIEIDLHIDSDLERAEHLATEIIETLTSRYIDLTNRQFDSIQKRYEVRNLNFKPQIQFLMNNDKNCIRMYLWFIAPYRDILNTRSQVLKELLKTFRQEPSILWYEE